ncbi:MAG: phosphoesterase [Cyclobacteriaceae bacterium]|nr:MAG: phosphoesterase [Cyclobacteriaceae bacterium]
MSDTHGYLDERVFEYFAGCDEVWHAGDIGHIGIIERLQNFKPLIAVYGNADDRNVRLCVPEHQWIERHGLLIWITHIGGSPPRYNPSVIKVLQQRQPQIFVCGHSHILKIARDSRYNNMLFINPGAAGQQGFHTHRTLVRLELASGKVAGAEVIELGRRGALP